MIDFAAKLKGLREIRGWSQEELAKRLKVSRSTIGNYEQGTREPRFEDLEAIADVFNCPMSYLLNDSKSSLTVELTDYEEQIIHAFRNASYDIQIAVCAVLGVNSDDIPRKSIDYFLSGGYDEEI
jgi:transcriptional regulator with XRE-family HTH domain